MASYVGIDIGNNTCKVALREGRGLRIISSRMPDNVVDEDHQIVSPETLSAHLGTLRREERIRERSCILVLAEPEVFFRHATLPPMTASPYCPGSVCARASLCRATRRDGWSSTST